MAGWEPSRLFVQKSELHKKSPENSTLCARPMQVSNHKDT
jgi:hypothetical protein